MNTRIVKKEIAALVGITPRTMRNNSEKYTFIENCRLNGTRRPTYDRSRIENELRRRRML